MERSDTLTLGTVPVYPERPPGSGHGIWEPETHRQGVEGSQGGRKGPWPDGRRGGDRTSEQNDHKDYDRNLFEILRKERKRLADKSKVPPYVIFSDKTLIEMATFFPQSKQSMLDIHGVGAVKHDKYGTVFLDIIQEYCKTHQIEERAKLTRGKPLSATASIGKKRHVVIGEAFNSGRPVSEIMDDFSIKRDTFLNHLFRYLQEGNGLIKSDELMALSTVSSEQKDHILDKFEDLGTEFLKPVFDALGGEIDYEELKIIRLYFHQGP